MRAHAEWNVITHITRTIRPTSPSTRSRISCAALLVNVIARISDGFACPVATRWATRCVSTRVLPEPAPASTSSGPLPCVTASRCGGLSALEQPLGARGCASVGFARASALPSGAGGMPATRRPRGSGPCRGAAAAPSAGCLRSLPGQLGDRALELGDPLREPAQRVGDRVGQVQPVGVRALGPAALDAHRVARVADHGRVRRHVVDHDGVRADLRAVADRDRAEQLGARADRDVVLDGRVALAGGEAGAAERHALEERHAVADLGRLADHDAGAVVDEELAADPGGGVDLDPGRRSGCAFEITRGSTGTSAECSACEIAVARIACTPGIGEHDLGRADRCARPGRGRARRRRPRGSRGRRGRSARRPLTRAPPRSCAASRARPASAASAAPAATPPELAERDRTPASTAASQRSRQLPDRRCSRARGRVPRRSPRRSASSSVDRDSSRPAPRGSAGPASRERCRPCRRPRPACSRAPGRRGRERDGAAVHDGDVPDAARGRAAAAAAAPAAPAPITIARRAASGAAGPPGRGRRSIWLA